MNTATKPRPNTALYFTTMVAFRKDMAVLGGHLYSDESSPTATRFMVCFGERWGHLTDLPDVAYAMSRKPGNPKAIAIMGRNGLYREIAGNNPPVDLQLPDIRSLYLMDIRTIGNTLYVCGVQNRILKQSGEQWLRMDEGCFAPFAGQVDRRLESIHGFSANDIYAVGAGGAIWHYDGKQWSKQDSPTNANLNIVLCASNGRVYIGGTKGMLLRGRRDSGWEEIGQAEGITGVIEDLTEFQGAIYAAATTELWRIAEDSAVKVEVRVEGERCFYAVDATDDALWCVGGEIVLRFDGIQWEQFVCPENQTRG